MTQVPSRVALHVGISVIEKTNDNNNKTSPNIIDNNTNMEKMRMVHKLVTNSGSEPTLANNIAVSKVSW